MAAKKAAAKKTAASTVKKKLLAKGFSPKQAAAFAAQAAKRSKGAK